MKLLLTLDEHNYTQDMTVYEKYSTRAVIIRNGRIATQHGAAGDYKILGGGVEPGEDLHAALIREVQEETGLTIQNPILCGVKQFPREDGARYVVLLFRATRFTGTLTSSSEGEMLWLTREELKDRRLTSDFLEMLRVFEDPILSEFYYYQAPGSEEWQYALL